MLFEDHKRRVERLLRGERRTEDLARLFSDLRNDRPGRASVREVGHFAAHRAERDAGFSLDRVNDLQTSTRLWQKQFDGLPPTVEHLREAGRANLNIMPDERIRERLGISRQSAPLFETSLAADTHCDLALLKFTPELEPTMEKLVPAEIERDRLAPLG